MRGARDGGLDDDAGREDPAGAPLGGPDRSWELYGEHFLHEARTYASWQSKDIRSAVRSAATTVAEPRAEGVYRIVTPEECVALGQELESLVLHPLCGGMPVEEAWRSMRLLGETVLPGSRHRAVGRGSSEREERGSGV